MNPELLAILEREFSGTLADIRAAALKEFNGTHIRSLRDASGPRSLIVACLTGEHEIRKAEKYLDFTDTGEPLDWARTSLMETIMFTVLGNGFSYEAERDTATRRITTLLLISAVPRSQTNLILERLFSLPP